MTNADPKILAVVKSFLERQQLAVVDERDEQNCTKLTIQNGTTKAFVSVFNTGTIKPEGKESPLKALLQQMKSAIEAGNALPGQALPFEIERFPIAIQERVPGVDPVIVRFVEEAIATFKTGALLSAAFMLGAASERAVNTLIETYAAALDAPAQERFRQRTGGKMISRRFDEFIQSYKSMKTRPAEADVGHDVDTIIGLMFQFCRVTRNEIGHPQIVPDLDKGAILANLGHFVTYIERIYRLKAFFEANKIVV